MSAPDQDAAHQLFQGLHRTGQLDALLAWFRREAAVQELELRVLLRQTWITDAEGLAHVHALQGALSAYAKILRKARTLGTPPQHAAPPEPAPPDAWELSGL